MDIIGEWTVDTTDRKAVAELGNVHLVFTSEGELIYTIRYPHKDQIIKLEYWMKGGTIFTDQPSSPRVERTKFEVTGEGVLTLLYKGDSYRFVRSQARPIDFGMAT